MIGVDPFTWFIAICLFLGYMATEAPYAVRGKISPRRQARIERAKARQMTAAAAASAAGGSTAVVGPAGPGPGRQALSAWWADWCEDATEWRRTRRQTRKARRDTQPIMPTAGTLTATVKRLTNTDTDDDAAATKQVPSGRNAALHRQFLAALARLDVLDAWKHNMAGLTADQRRQYWARIATLSPNECADQLNNELAEYARVADQRMKQRYKQAARETGNPFPERPALRPLSTTNPNPIHFTNGGSDVSNNNEIVTLGQAIAWGQQQSEQASLAVSDAEVVAASLSSQEVSGEPIALCAQIQEAASQLAALYTTFSETMASHTGVAEAYAATPDAGNKEFNQLG